MATTNLADLESRLWSAADELRANSSLSPTEYRGPVLGLIFLAFAEHRFDALRPELESRSADSGVRVEHGRPDPQWRRRQAVSMPRDSPGKRAG